MQTFSKESFDITYSSRLFSTTTLFCFIVYAIIIIIPFVLAFASDNFWIMVTQESQFMNIEYEGQYYVELSQVATKNRSIFTNINPLIVELDKDDSKYFIGGSIQQYQEDQDSDGIMDNISINISLPILNTQAQSITIVMPIKCTFPSLNFAFSSIIYIQEMSISGISSLDMSGKLHFIQQQPIPYNNFMQDLYLTTPLNTGTDYIEQIISEYFIRDFQVKPKGSIVMKSPGNGQNQVDIRLYFETNQAQFIDKWISLMATLKLAWLQYMSLFILVWLIGREFLIFSFRFRIVPSARKQKIIHQSLEY